MTEEGHCEHGKFILSQGCPQCIADRMAKEGNTEASIGEAVKAANRQIVKVRYYSQTTGIPSDREYTYFSADRLNVGDVVHVPVRDTTAKAKISAIDVPPAEIMAFADKVKTIPAGSLVPKKLKPEQEEMEAGLNAEGLTLEEHLERAPFLKQVEEDIGVLEPETETSVALRPGEDAEAQGYHAEALGLLKWAEARVITTAEDDKLANDDLIAIGKLKKVMEDKRVSLVKPKQDEVKAIQETYKALMAPVLDADRITRSKMTNFKLEQRRKAEEAEALNRQAIEVARKQAEMNNGEFTTNITPVDVPAAPKLTRTDQGTSGLVDNWKYRVVDIDLIPRAYMIPDDAMLKNTAKLHHDKKPVPGVEFYNEPGLRTTAR